MAEVKERPIIFSGPMVRAILEGRKTQTRRVIKPQPIYEGSRWTWGSAIASCFGSLDEHMSQFCPYGQPGDVLYVKESCGYVHWEETIYETVTHDMAVDAGEPSMEGMQVPWGSHRESALVYRADNPDAPVGRWTPSTYMPKSLARLWLRVTDVRVERLKDISEEDCFAEGIDDEGEVYDEGERFQSAGSPVTAAHYTFTALWGSINAKRGYGWDTNPWVWVVSFERYDHG